MDYMNKQQYIKKVQQQLNEKFNKYTGLSFSNVARAVGINPEILKTKLSTVNIVKKLKEIEDFNEDDLIFGEYIKSVSLKTVRLKHNGIPKESMSFEQIKFNELVRESWETSKLREKFLTTTFLFVVFEYEGKNTSVDNLYFRGFYVWQMPLKTLDNDVKKVWEKTKKLLQDGLEIKVVKRGIKTVQSNNLPGIRFNNVAHVRPKANDSSDKVFLPNGQSITKQAFWLNADFIAEVIREMPKVTNYKKSKVEFKPLETTSIEKIKKKLVHPIYTFDDFNNISSKVVDKFEENYFNSENISAMGYNIHPNFILIKEISRPEEYFEQKIFEQDYFTKTIDPIYDSGPFLRKLVNLENSYDLLKVEENTYITIKKLNEAGIYKKDLIDFKNKIENFVSDGQFFTWDSIVKAGFQNELIDLGFQEIFYESLLKRPGAFKYMKINQTSFFVKSIDDFNISDFFRYLMGEKTSISLNELDDKFIEQFSTFINRDNIGFYAKQSLLYYSEELERLFISREVYYQYIE